MVDQTDITFDTEEAAVYLKQAVITLESWRAKEAGPRFYKPSHKVIYYKSDLDNWIKGENK
jgi:hypothetical protein